MSIVVCPSAPSGRKFKKVLGPPERRLDETNPTLYDRPMATRKLVATCSRGLEEVLAAELDDLGGHHLIAGKGVVSFQGDRRCMIRACLGLRSAIRVLVPLVERPVNKREDLYELALTVPWEEHLRHGGTVAVTVAARSEVFNHSRFAAQVVKDAVVDRIRDRRGERPSVDLKNPDLAIHLHVSGGRAAIALDAAGAPLSKRGYRPRGGPAPLNEALAAGLLLLAGYDGEAPLLDPMGGTGTFAAEAALIATRTPPGLRRRFAFERWIDHNRKVFESARRELEKKRRAAPQPIIATDHDHKAIDASVRNIEAAGMQQWVQVRHGEATAMESPGEGSLIVINPPYGHRLGDSSSLRGLYQGLGDRLKNIGTGCTAWILAGNRELAKSIGLRASRRIQVFNGPIECRWMRFDLYSGSRKHKRTDAEPTA